MAVDIVYPLGNGSKWENNEIRYSLRSIEKYAKNINNIWIIGDKPKFLNSNIIEYGIRDFSSCPSTNILRKLQLACRKSDITDNFLYMNDDHFLLKEVNISNYPNYHYGNLQERFNELSDNWYQNYLRDTYNILRAMKLPTINFDIHTPILINKRRFLEIMSHYNFNRHKLIIKSLYCNTQRIEGEYLEDLKITTLLNTRTIEMILKDRHIFSIGDRCLGSKNLVNYIKRLYPSKSKYEL